ncbi:EPOXIDE HYDROLASE [Salix koriyanagi]|uniref:EPOXIDE HYDROLASE n=1 Tax=Salix koriyanagi TaxID=2511006 RepID=A0A9Q0V0S7_9ROSI|nr:EPOXIDE HYDROLASE [Salix koriyanagi]
MKELGSKFTVGEKDVGFVFFGTKDCIDGEIFEELVPNVEVAAIDGHHFTQQENAGQLCWHQRSVIILWQPRHRKAREQYLLHGFGGSEEARIGPLVEGGPFRGVDFKTKSKDFQDFR